MSFPNSNFEDIIREQSYLFDEDYSIMNDTYFSQGTGNPTPAWTSIVKQSPPIENNFILIDVDSKDLAEASENAFNPVIGTGRGPDTDGIPPVDEKVCFAQAVAINVGCSADADAEIADDADTDVAADAEVPDADDADVAADADAAADDGWLISTGTKKNYRRNKNKVNANVPKKQFPQKKPISQHHNYPKKNAQRSVSETDAAFERINSYPPKSSPFTINLKNVDARIASAVIGQCGRVQQDLMKRYNLKSLHIGDPVRSTSHKKHVNITIVGITKHLVTSAARTVCKILSKEEDNYIELDFNTFKNYLNACRV